MIGTSNTKYLSTKYIAGANKTVRKEIRYDIKSAKEFIQDFGGDDPDIVVYQVTCNDIEKQAYSETLSKLDDLVNTRKNNFCAKKSKVLISLPLPRKEKKLNDKAKVLSAMITSKFAGGDQVTVSDNSNLTYRGEPLEGIMYDDKHLSRWGTN